MKAEPETNDSQQHRSALRHVRLPQNQASRSQLRFGNSPAILDSRHILSIILPKIAPQVVVDNATKGSEFAWQANALGYQRTVRKKPGPAVDAKEPVRLSHVIWELMDEACESTSMICTSDVPPPCLDESLARSLLHI